MTELNNANGNADGDHYTMPFLPPGSYRMMAYAETLPSVTSSWALAEPLAFTVPASGAVTLNLSIPVSNVPVGESFSTLLYSAPANLADSGAVPQFQFKNDLSLDTAVLGWTIDLSKVVYSIGVEDRCGNSAWDQISVPPGSALPDISIAYGSTAGVNVEPPAVLSQSPFFKQVLKWHVTGSLNVVSGPTPTTAPTATSGPSATPSPTDSASPTPSATPVESTTPSPSATATPTLTPLPIPTGIPDAILNRGEQPGRIQQEAQDLNGDDARDISDYMRLLKTWTILGVIQ